MTKERGMERFRAVRPNVVWAWQCPACKHEHFLRERHASTLRFQAHVRKQCEGCAQIHMVKRPTVLDKERNIKKLRATH